ncbi:uncharacterized protein LOC117233282 [Bombus vosnesenskii]|uniref:Uncharacterized protein LOC117233282 n=2 Tax=Pyrobombus TaxID=144703 RepID=A0A6J3K8B0_9HYME|nr:uncharacterized protein LOC117166669 [Bombus vancouverensis nearcticus]XP_033316867.1 uncharacterized protein LOC117214707 [Bombus bifarius]XP_033349332.1 uncharacterized protein LOC117233282 [Bombus vosnesenskii]
MLKYSCNLWIRSYYVNNFIKISRFRIIENGNDIIWWPLPSMQEIKQECISCQREHQKSLKSNAPLRLHNNLIQTVSRERIKSKSERCIHVSKNVTPAVNSEMNSVFTLRISTLWLYMCVRQNVYLCR